MTNAETSIHKLAKCVLERGPLTEAVTSHLTDQELNRLPLNFQVTLSIAIKAEHDLLALLAVVASERVTT